MPSCCMRKRISSSQSLLEIGIKWISMSDDSKLATFPTLKVDTVLWERFHIFIYIQLTSKQTTLNKQIAATIKGSKHHLSILGCAPRSSNRFTLGSPTKLAVLHAFLYLPGRKRKPCLQCCCPASLQLPCPSYPSSFSTVPLHTAKDGPKHVLFPSNAYLYLPVVLVGVRAISRSIG
ncbi:uncharacterized protein LOC134216443 [Armigeres subalbatus]|uniref:uncharacterized protein LOC134216443 n=1 Tax=Armigeres subalbatus TaxID=124917 RepID=UPI002ED03EFB